LESDQAPAHLQSIVRDIQPAIEAAKGKPGDALAAAITENAREVALRLKTRRRLVIWQKRCGSFSRFMTFGRARLNGPRTNSPDTASFG